MMTGNVVICYALTGERIPALQERIELISKGVRRAGLRTYAHIREEQKWHVDGAPPRQILDRVFREIDQAEAVLLDLTGGPEAKRVGLNIEAGYATARNKTIFALWRQPERPPMTADLAHYEDRYTRTEDIEAIVHRRFTRWLSERTPMPSPVPTHRRRADSPAYRPFGA